MARLLVIVAVLSMLAAGGCKSVPAPAQSTRAIHDADLPAMALRSTDLADGFTVVGEQYLPTDALVANIANADERRGQLETWGRTMGYRVTLESNGRPRPRTPTRVQSDIEHYADVAGAQARLRGFDPPRDLGISAVALQELKPESTIGDEMRAFRMFGRDGDADRVIYVTAIRIGPIVSVLTTTGDTHRDDKGVHAARLSRLVRERATATLR
jgi:hypothetical protein